MNSRCMGPLVSAVAFLATGGVAQVAQAHFVLQAPAAMTEQNDLGDPQKAPNCGDDGTAVMTGMRTSYAAGETIDITVSEQIYHPGHYRVAIALNDPSELPDAPPVTSTPQDQCAMTEIDADPQFPILADGMLAHEAPFNGPQTFQVTLPDDIECENCTLQILEYMSSHGAPCFYYHCANISITGAKGGSTGEGPETTGPGDSTGTPPNTTGDDSTSASPSASESDSMSSADPGGTGDDNPTTSTTTTPPATGSESGGQGSNDDEGGCSVPGRSGQGGPAVLMLLGGLLAWRRRG